MERPCSLLWLLRDQRNRLADGCGGLVGTWVPCGTCFPPCREPTPETAWAHWACEKGSGRPHSRPNALLLLGQWVT